MAESEWDFLDKQRVMPLTYKYNPEKLGSYTNTQPKIQSPRAGGGSLGGGLMGNPAPATSSKTGNSFGGALGKFLGPVLKKGVNAAKDWLNDTPSTGLEEVPKIPDTFTKPITGVQVPLRPPTGIGDVFNPSTWTGAHNPFNGFDNLPYKSEAFNPKNYEGTLYDGSIGKIGLDFDPTLNYQKPSAIQEKIGDMMDTAGKVVSVANIGKGIYDLTQGAGGKGGSDLAAGIGGMFVPGVGLAKGAFDLVMGIGQYIKGRGRQYNFYHPYAIDAIQDKNGLKLVRMGSRDSTDDARDLAQRNLMAGSGGNFVDYSEAGPAAGMDSYLVQSPDTGEMYWIDPMKYMDTTPYGYDSVQDMKDAYWEGLAVDYDKTLPENYNELVSAWKDNLNASFLQEMLTGGIDFDHAGVSRLKHGAFMDKGDVALQYGSDSVNNLLRMNELRDMYNNASQFIDTSSYQDWTNPGMPEETWKSTGFDPNMEYGI